MTSPVRPGVSSVTPTQVIRAGILAGSSFYDADTGELVATTATARAALAALDGLQKQLGGEQSSPVAQEGSIGDRISTLVELAPQISAEQFAEKALPLLMEADDALVLVSGWHHHAEQGWADEAAERAAAEASLVAHREALERAEKALRRVDKIASHAHDAMWAMDFDKTSAGRIERLTWVHLRKIASDHIHKLHDTARAALAVVEREEERPDPGSTA